MTLPPIPATHSVPLPVVYRSEAPNRWSCPSWWPDVPSGARPAKPGPWLCADEDRVVCASCGRVTHEVLEKRRRHCRRSTTIEAQGPKGTPTLCLDCGRGIHSRARSEVPWCWRSGSTSGKLPDDGAAESPDGAARSTAATRAGVGQPPQERSRRTRALEGARTEPRAGRRRGSIERGAALREWRLPGCGDECRPGQHDPAAHEEFGARQERERNAGRWCKSGRWSLTRLPADGDGARRPATVAPREMRLLLALAERPGEVVSYEELGCWCWAPTGRTSSGRSW